MRYFNKHRIIIESVPKNTDTFSCLFYVIHVCGDVVIGEYIVGVVGSGKYGNKTIAYKGGGGCGG